MNELKQKLDIYLYEDTIKKLEEEAYRVGLSVSRLVEVAIEYKYVKQFKNLNHTGGKSK